MGDHHFDRLFGSVDPGAEPVFPLKVTGDLAEYIPGMLLKKLDLNSKNEPVLSLGALYYFKNHANYTNRHPAGFFQGEHSLYVGDDPQKGPVWTGLGVKNKTKEEMSETLWTAYNTDRTKEDYAQILAHSFATPEKSHLQKYVHEKHEAGYSYQELYETVKENGDYILPAFIEAERELGKDEFLYGVESAKLDTDAVKLDVENIMKFKQSLDHASLHDHG